MPTKPQVQIQIPCPQCNQTFKSKQGVHLHQHHKHPNAPKTPSLGEPTPVLPSLQSSNPNSNEKAELLAEIARLQKEIGEKPAAILTQPEPEPQYREEIKPKVPWLVKDAKPAYRAQIQDLKDADTKQIKNTLSIFAKAKPQRIGIEYAESKPIMIEYKSGSWMDVYKEDLLVRTIPFIWQQDKETKQNWAICLEQQFYGKKMGGMQFSYPLLIIPFNKSRKYVDYYGRGFKIGADEVSQLQVPLHELDSDEKLQARLEDNAYNSQNMALYRELIIHAKKKWNWTLIIIIVLVLVALGIAAYYIYTHPQLLKGLGSSFTIIMPLLHR